MTHLFLILQLFALGYPTPPPSPPVFQQAQQGPKPVLPAHVRGPHEGEPNAFCSRNETFKNHGDTIYECKCAFQCDMGAGGEPLQREADDCVTACGKDQCLCHLCETCDQPEPKR